MKTSDSLTSKKHTSILAEDLDSSPLVIQLIENEVLPNLQSGKATYLVVAQKKLQVMALPPLPGEATEKSSSLAPLIRTPNTVRDRWRKDSLMGFAYIVRGEADLLLSRRVVTCRAGTFVLFLPHTWRSQGATSHWERPEPRDASCDILWLFLKPGEVLSHICWSRGAIHTNSHNLFIPDNRILSLVELLHEEASRSETSEAATQMLWLIYDRVRRSLHEGRFLPERVAMQGISRESEAAGSIGQRAQEYIDANLMERLTLESVARTLFTSRTRLSREFYNHTGETFGSYLIRCRIARAKHLLATTSYSIKEIAWRAGFTDPDYFSGTFHRIVGTTPTKYRKKGR